MFRRSFSEPLLPNPSRHRRRRSTIGLTPLIDVVFILLLFFMLASSFDEWRSIGLEPPASATAGQNWNGALLVEVRKDGLRVSGRQLSLTELVSRVAARLEREPDQRILIKPGKRVSLQETVIVFDGIAETGARNVSLTGSSAR